MLWRPNTQYISSRHVQYINRSQLLITDLQPAEDDTRRRLCSATLMNPSASSPLAFHPSLPACHLTPFPVIAPVRPSFHPRRSSFLLNFCPPLSPSVISIHLSCLPTLRHASQGTTEGFSSYCGLVYAHVIPSSASDQVCAHTPCLIM